MSNSPLKKWAKLLIPLLLGGFFLWYFFYSTSEAQRFEIWELPFPARQKSLQIALLTPLLIDNCLLFYKGVQECVNSEQVQSPCTHLSPSTH